MTETITEIKITDKAKSYIYSEEFQCNDRPDSDRINGWREAVTRRYIETFPLNYGDADYRKRYVTTRIESIEIMTRKV